MKGKIIKLLSLLVILLTQRVNVSGAYLTDSTTLSEVTVSVGNWVPLPNPSLEFFLTDDKKAVSFTASDIKDFQKITYEIIYDSTNGDKGISGSADLTGENAFSRSNLLLGTCSEIEGKVCTYDEGITKLHLKVTLVSGGVETVLEKEINY